MSERTRVTLVEPPRRVVGEMDAGAAQFEAVRALIRRFEAKFLRVLDRVRGVV